MNIQQKNHSNFASLSLKWIWFFGRKAFISIAVKNLLLTIHSYIYISPFLLWMFLGSCTYTSMLKCSLLRKLRGTIVNIILPPWVLFYRREFYFTAARSVLMLRGLFYCREFYFTAASFILLPQDLFYCPEFYFHCREFYFLHREFYFTAPRFNVKIKLAAVK